MPGQRRVRSAVQCQGTPRCAIVDPPPLVIEPMSRVVRIRTNVVGTYREASSETNEKQVITGSRRSGSTMGRNPPHWGLPAQAIGSDEFGHQTATPGTFFRIKARKMQSDKSFSVLSDDTLTSGVLCRSVAACRRISRGRSGTSRNRLRNEVQDARIKGPLGPVGTRRPAVPRLARGARLLAVRCDRPAATGAFVQGERA